MIREAQEEVGIVIKESDLKVCCAMHRKAHDREIIDYFMTARNWHGPIQNLEPDKCKELKFFPLTRLPANIIPYVRFGIECSLNNTPFVEFGWGD